MQTALHVIFPPRCLSCGVSVDSDHSLCGSCWRDAGFISGLTCTLCGVPMMGEDCDDGAAVICDDCIAARRPWTRGFAAALYQDSARKLILALKHGDRTDLAKPIGRWMAAAGAPILSSSAMLVPIPLHPWRYLKRRYNQSALLATEIAAQSGAQHIPDALKRVRRTKIHDGLSLEDRFTNMSGAIDVNPKQARHLRDRDIVLIDDVMTSGATMTAASQAVLGAGANSVSSLVFARVAKPG